MTTNNSVNSPLSGTTGTGNFVGSNSPNITTPKIITGILDSNGNTILGLSPVASAVNYVAVQDTPTGASPALFASGSDTNIQLTIGGQGNGGVTIQGTKNGGNATSGYVGEFISSVISSGSTITFSSGVTKDLTSISLTAGDWEVFGNITAISGPGIYDNFTWISLTSATQPDSSLYNVNESSGVVNQQGVSAPYFRANLSSTTTIYLSGLMYLVSGTASCSGAIYARRVR